VIDQRQRLSIWARRLRAGACDETALGLAPPDSAWGAEVGSAPDRQVWHVATSVEVPSDHGLERIPGLRIEGDGPLLQRGATDAVEVWVDRELAAMHALGRIARRLERAAWFDRLRRAVEWHVEHTGTENATHRPWAVHLFVLHGSPDPEFFASGQLHAVTVEHGGARPDPCTSWILRDAARELDLAVEGAASGLP
jgi:hypothetical protein